MIKPLYLMSPIELLRHSKNALDVTKIEIKDENEALLEREHDVQMKDEFQSSKELAQLALVNGHEVPLLADCVWFICSLSKHLQVQSVSPVPHITLHMINRFAMKIGIQKALVDEDRFLLAAACFFIATKVTSQHCKPESILEFYHENRPLKKTFEVPPFEQIKFDLAFVFHQLEIKVYC